MEDRPGGVTDLTDRRFPRPVAHPVACAARARSSGVEHWFYTPAVGGSIPSAPTSVCAGQCYFLALTATTENDSIRCPVGHQCPNGLSQRVVSQRVRCCDQWVSGGPATQPNNEAPTARSVSGFTSL